MLGIMLVGRVRCRWLNLTISWVPDCSISVLGRITQHCKFTAVKQMKLIFVGIRRHARRFFRFNLKVKFAIWLILMPLKNVHCTNVSFRKCVFWDTTVLINASYITKRTWCSMAMPFSVVVPTVAIQQKYNKEKHFVKKPGWVFSLKSPPKTPKNPGSG